MLQKIYIDGYRHFKKCEIEFQPTTLLCGRNGTGKSSVVEIIAKLRDFIHGKNSATNQPFSVEMLCPLRDVPRWALEKHGKTETRFIFTLEYNQTIFEYSLLIEHSFRDAVSRVGEESLFVNNEKLYFAALGEAQILTDDKKEKQSSLDWTFSGLNVASRFNANLAKFQQDIGKLVYAVSLSPRGMCGMHTLKSAMLAVDGSNFSAWYDGMLDENHGKSAKVLSEYKNFIEGFDKTKFNTIGETRSLVYDMKKREKEYYEIEFSELSDGQKILCALYALIIMAQDDTTIVIDEFENYLSSVELTPFYVMAQEALEERNIQTIIISHHEKTLNFYNASALIFSLQEIPATVRVEKYPGEKYPGALADAILDQSTESYT